LEATGATERTSWDPESVFYWFLVYFGTTFWMLLWYFGATLVFSFHACFQALFYVLLWWIWSFGTWKTSIWCETVCKNQLVPDVGILLISVSFFAVFRSLGISFHDFWCIGDGLWIWWFFMVILGGGWAEAIHPFEGLTSVQGGAPTPVC
jgi:hypothetical protein